MDGNEITGTGMKWRYLAIVVIVLLIASIILFVPPIPQDPDYHLFADRRNWLGVPHFANTASNLGFFMVGLYGLFLCVGAKRAKIFKQAGGATAFFLFFAGTFFVALGSSYYHLAPDNDRLYWDRLPMTVSFMAITAAILRDRIAKLERQRWLLPLLMIAGVSSVTYWAWSELTGQGDLRFYAIVQFLPLAALPVILFCCRGHTYLPTSALLWVIFWYGLAKLFEHFDRQIFDLAGMMMSGHTLKHLAAAMAPLVIARALFHKSLQP